MVGIPKISDYEKSCLNCYYFDFNPGRPRLNRECLFEGAVTTRGGVCQMWRDTRTLKERLQGKKVMKAFC